MPMPPKHCVMYLIGLIKSREGEERPKQYVRVNLERYEDISSDQAQGQVRRFRDRFEQCCRDGLACAFAAQTCRPNRQLLFIRAGTHGGSALLSVRHCK